MAYTPPMGAVRRGSVAAGLALAAASCSLLAPLDGLTGGNVAEGGAQGGPDGGDAAQGAADAPRETVSTTDSAADTTAETSPAGDGTTGDALAETSGGDATTDAADATAKEGGVDSAPDAPSSVYRAAVLADAPLAYWRLGETTGTVAHDETGNGHDGTYVGGFTLGQTGALTGYTDTAVKLDGSTGEIDVGDLFDFTGATPFSFEVWVYATLMDTTFRHVMTKMAFNGSGNPVDGTYLLLYSSTTDFGFERYSASTAELAIDVNAYPGINQWVYVVATYDCSIGTVYVNGTSAAAETALGGVTASGVHMLWGNLLQGNLDEIAVYGAALSQARITAHYQASK
jgi:hypothetical protein